MFTVYLKLGDLLLGKSEQLFDDGVPIKAISELEISNYEVAVRSYRGATAVLRSYTRALESINADILPRGESFKLTSRLHLNLVTSS